MWPVLVFPHPISNKFLLTHPVWDVTAWRLRWIRPRRFLLTHPVWDVTPHDRRRNPPEKDFYSHIPCGMWPFTDNYAPTVIRISTHTSRVGCDGWRKTKMTDKYNFYSHIPCGMWHIENTKAEYGIDFYSHIPCGMWRVISTANSLIGNFYSHIPCGMWPTALNHLSSRVKFLLTHPVWDVTSYLFQTSCWFCHFYSHIPCGMWLFLFHRLKMVYIISTHTSRVGCDVLNFGCKEDMTISTHTSRVGCDQFFRIYFFDR